MRVPVFGKITVDRAQIIENHNQKDHQGKQHLAKFERPLKTLQRRLNGLPVQVRENLDIEITSEQVPRSRYMAGAQMHFLPYMRRDCFDKVTISLKNNSDETIIKTVKQKIQGLRRAPWDERPWSLLGRTWETVQKMAKEAEKA